MILLALSSLLLLAVLHSRFRTASGRLARAGALVAALAAGLNYRQEVRDAHSQAMNCRFPEQPARDHRCYNPHNRDEFIQHLKACKIEPGQYPAEDSPAIDPRGVPCDYFDQFQNPAVTGVVAGH
jgi:hypothetical protein